MKLEQKPSVLRILVKRKYITYALKLLLYTVKWRNTRLSCVAGDAYQVLCCCTHDTRCLIEWSCNTHCEWRDMLLTVVPVIVELVTLPKRSVTLSCPTSFIPKVSTPLWYRNCHMYSAGNCRSPTDSADNSKWMYCNCSCETWGVGEKHKIWHKNCTCLQSTFFLMTSCIRTTRRKHMFPEEPYIYCTYTYEISIAWSYNNWRHLTVTWISKTNFVTTEVV